MFPKEVYYRSLFGLKINSIVKAIPPGVDCLLYVDDFLICYRSKHIHHGTTPVAMPKQTI